MRWNDYQVHDVAGTHYLVDVAQSGECYRPPMEVTGTGAYICRRMIDGASEDVVAQELSSEYDMLYENAFDDVHDFIFSVENRTSEKREKVYR